MEKTIKINGIDVNYSLRGDSNKETIVFLHGYLENMTIWQEFAGFFEQNYQVLCVDLPGHGKTAVFFQEHSMKLMADIVFELTEILNIQKFTLVGHSMGGYVSLAFAEYYSNKLNAFVLFHSHVYADDEQKKAARNAEIEKVKAGKYNEVVETNIPRMYAPYNLEKFADKIEFSKEIARKIPEEGVIAALEGMKNRPDRLHVIAETKLPHMFIVGKDDLLIPYNPDDSQFSVNKNTKTVVLNSGHMGMFEDKEKALESLAQFISN